MFVLPCKPRLLAVLAIGGVGGLAVGLAGREILENLFTGLIILSSNPFEVRGRGCWEGGQQWRLELRRALHISCSDAQPWLPPYRLLILLALACPACRAGGR